MGKVSISVDRVESRLAVLGKDRPWLESQIGWGKNMLTNFKGRDGIPAAYAVDLASILGVSTDWLFEISRETENVARGDEAGTWLELLEPNPKAIAEMVSIYCYSDKEGRQAIRAAIEVAKDNLSAAARDKLEQRG